MNFIIVASIGLAIVLSSFIVLLVWRRHKKGAETLRLRRQEIEKRQAKAQWAKAIVVDVESDIVYGAATQATLKIVLDVHPQNGSTYRANTSWLVDIAVLSSIRQGREIAVKIDSANSRIIYPHASWASYLCE